MMILMKVIKCCTCFKDKEETEFGFYHSKMNRTCIKCRKYHNDFYSQNTDGYKDKRRDYYLKNKKAHRERAFKNNLKRQYGLSLEDYKEMLRVQDNRCAICKDDFFSSLTKRPEVDHCHDTGKVRGLLCKECNLRVLPLVERFEKYRHEILEYLSKSKI
mgnify:CR=1 FL=1